MTEWSIVTVIIALVGLIVTVAKPLMQVNSTMVHLSEQMQSLTDKPPLQPGAGVISNDKGEANE